MTPLDKLLKRALKVKGRDYVIALTPDSLKITEKGRRIGVELAWVDLISGESALAVALHASLGAFTGEARTSTKTKTTSAARRSPPRARPNAKARR
jgi:hypothetical protein